MTINPLTTLQIDLTNRDSNGALFNPTTRLFTYKRFENEGDLEPASVVTVTTQNISVGVDRVTLTPQRNEHGLWLWEWLITDATGNSFLLPNSFRVRKLK